VSGAFLSVDWLTILLTVLIGSSLGAIIGFEIGNKFRKKASLIEHWIGKERTEKFEKGINKKGVWFITLAALSPVPYIPLILGMMHLSRKNFIIYGMIPRMISFILFYPFYQMI
jgi:membrane protein YqaA with SNARE-associated domain